VWAGRDFAIDGKASRPHALTPDVRDLTITPLEERRRDIMFSVLADGPRRHRLAAGDGAEVGWIRGRAIGFRGFRSKSDVIAAASAGWRALHTLLHREYASWPRQVVDWERLRFVHDGAHEWVSDGHIPLARLQRLQRNLDGARTEGAPVRAAAHELAVEFVVPSWMDEAAMIPIAHALWNVLAPLLRVDADAATQSRPAPHPARRPSAHPSITPPPAMAPAR
jgi:hypothetical protein